MPKVAVLLPVYKKDNPSFFELSLNSVLNQTIDDIVVLIGVDGPVDGKLASKLKRVESAVSIRVFYFPENRGLACVLNDLISEAKKIGCEFYARMDADDICLPDRFEKQISFLSSNPEIDVVGGKIEEIDAKGNLIGKSVEYPHTHSDCRKFFRYRDPLAHPAVMFRNSFFEMVSGYRPEYRKNQDTMLWFDGFINGCVFANIPDTVLNFRITEDFYNRRNGKQRAKQMLNDRRKMNKALKYDITANCFAYAMYLMTISPAWVKEFLYKIR